MKITPLRNSELRLLAVFLVAVTLFFITPFWRVEWGALGESLGFLLALPVIALADLTLSLIQWLLDYYPEDSDPEFFWTVVILGFGWYAALSVLLFRVAGFLKQNYILLITGGVYILIALSMWAKLLV